MRKSLIKVLTGQRRVGKSYILYQLMQLIRSEEPDANIIYINKEQMEFDVIRTAKDLNDYVVSQCMADKHNYIFIDEIQDIDEFEKAMRSLLLNEWNDIYITGSNATMLSGELATYLSGRYIEIPIYGLSYTEFLSFHSLPDTEESLAKYFKYGGLPYLIHLELTDEVVPEYLRSIYSTIIFRDVVTRHNIRNTVFLENFISFLADNIGNVFSAKKISDYLKSQNLHISTNQILQYSDYLCAAFLIHKVGRYDIVGKRMFEIGDKYYFEDLGIRNTAVKYKPQDRGKLLENVVYNHLRYCGYTVNIGAMSGQEIDFVCERHGERRYVQVALRLDEETTIRREFGNLLKIQDNYPKEVVTMDKFFGSSYMGVKHVHIADFLKEE
jgi:predicted AAA+ superfamily ATPase